MRRDALAAVIAAARGACTPGIYHAPVRQPNYYSVGSDGARSLQYSQINEWVTYGTDGLGAQARVAAGDADVVTMGTRTMREWVSFAQPTELDSWVAVARDAHRYVSALTP